MVDDLLVFVRAQLDEDERVARGLDGATTMMGASPNFYGCGGPSADVYWRHFRPTRALRGVAADRTLLDQYERVLAARERHRAAVAELDADIDAENRTGVWSGAGFPDVRQRALRREADYLDGMEPVLRTLVRARAAVYAGRPGFREEWRP